MNHEKAAEIVNYAQIANLNIDGHEVEIEDMVGATYINMGDITLYVTPYYNWYLNCEKDDEEHVHTIWGYDESGNAVEMDSFYLNGDSYTPEVFWRLFIREVEEIL